jgi:hypothetical protein
MMMAVVPIRPAEDLAEVPWLTVGFDVLGGRFAVNGGGLPGQPGEVCYWGPDTLAWTALGAGYSQFARMVLSGGDQGLPGLNREPPARGEAGRDCPPPAAFALEAA